MPATTSKFKIPYPTGGDPVRDGPQTFTEAANILDDWLADPFIIVEGKRYPLSGSIVPPDNFNYISGWVGNYSQNYNATISITAPYQPPEGYTFQVFTLIAGGFIHLSTRRYVRETQQIEALIYQGGAANLKDLKLIGWRLISTSTNPNRLNQGVNQ